MAYYRAVKAADLTQGNKIRVNIAGQEVMLTNVDGSYYAVTDRCGHMNGSLSLGKLEGRIIECPLHRARYDVISGKCVSGPQMGGLEGVFLATTGAGRLVASIETLDLKVFRTKIENEFIMIEIPECEVPQKT